MFILSILDRLICEAYLCDYNYTNCQHSLLQCPIMNQPDYFYTCKSEYMYNDDGYLIPVFKGCVSLHVTRSVQYNECLIDNTVKVFKGSKFWCYCIGDYCNENETFTHVIRLESYGML